MSEVQVIEQRGFQPVTLVLDSSHRRFGTRRFRFVVGCLAGVAMAALLMVVLPADKVADILCCDGCCRVSLSQPKASISQPHSATILHLSGSREIDYTRNGHRVPLHMESALNELDHIERHVKLGLPKYLQESAAQREADLVNHKFERDLEGAASSTHDDSDNIPKIVAEPAAPLQPVGTGTTGAKLTITQAVAEASRMEAGLRKKDHEEEGRIIAPSSRELSRDHLEAEKEAAIVGKFAKSLSSSKQAVARSKGSAPHNVEIRHNDEAKAKHGNVASTSDHRITKQAMKEKDSAGAQADDRKQLQSTGKNAPAGVVPLVASKGLQDVKARHHAHVADAAARHNSLATRAEPAGSGVDPAEWARLQGIQSRIEKLIGGYTGGASRHSSFFKHFDDEDSTDSRASLASRGGGESNGGDGDDSAVQLAEAEAAKDKKAFLNL